MESRKEKEKVKKSGAEAGKGQTWKYLVVMSFLEPYITPRDSSGNMPRRRAEEEQTTGYNHPEEEPEEAAAAGLSGAEDTATTTQGETSWPELPAAAAASSSAGSSSVRAGPSPASAPTGPPRKRARKRPTSVEPPTEWERELLETLRTKAAAPPHYSEDPQFLLSLFPLLQRVAPESKEFVKFKMYQL